MPSLGKSNSGRNSVEVERVKLSVIGSVRTVHPEVEFQPMIIAAVNYTMRGSLPDGVPLAKVAEQTTAVLKESIGLLKTVKEGTMDSLIYVEKRA
jgi:hypothetical protein